MVSAGEILRPPPALSAALTPILATSQLTTVQAFAIPTWRPRDGLDKQHSLWMAGVRRLLAAYDLSETDLQENVTQCRAVLSGAQSFTLSTDQVEAHAQATLLNNIIHQWQAINTSVFWHVLASVDPNSSYTLIDISFIENLCNPLLADGLELLNYLRRISDTSVGHSGNATSDSELDSLRPEGQPVLGNDSATCEGDGKSHAHSVIGGGVTPTSRDKPELDHRNAILEGGAPASTTAGGAQAIDTSLNDLLGEPDADNDDFEAWVQQHDHDECSPGIMALNWDSDNELIIEGSQQPSSLTGNMLSHMSTRSQSAAPRAELLDCGWDVPSPPPSPGGEEAMVPEVFMNRTAICQQWSEWHNYLMNTINDNEFATYASTLAVQRHAHVASFTVNVPESVRVRVLHVWRRVIMAPAGRYLDDANRDDAIATALRDIKDVDWIAAGVHDPLPPNWNGRLRQQWTPTSTAYGTTTDIKTVGEPTSQVSRWTDWHAFLCRFVGDDSFAEYASSLATKRSINVASFIGIIPKDMHAQVLDVWRQVLMAPAGQYIDDANRDDALATALHNIAEVDWVAAGVHASLPPNWKGRVRQQCTLTLPIPNAHRWAFPNVQPSIAEKRQRLEAISTHASDRRPERTCEQRANCSAAEQQPRTPLTQAEQDEVLEEALRPIRNWSTVMWNDDDLHVIRVTGRGEITRCLRNDPCITKHVLRKAIKGAASSVASRRANRAAKRLQDDRRQHAASLAQGSQITALLTSGGLPAEGPAQVIGAHVAAINATVPAQLEDDILQQAVHQRLQEKPNAYVLFSSKTNTLVYTRGGTRGVINTKQRDEEVESLIKKGASVPTATQFINDKMMSLQTRLQKGESPPESDDDSDSMPHMG
jgi:hypothetical protein